MFIKIINIKELISISVLINENSDFKIIEMNFWGSVWGQVVFEAKCWIHNTPYSKLSHNTTKQAKDWKFKYRMYLCESCL